MLPGAQDGDDALPPSAEDIDPRSRKHRLITALVMSATLASAPFAILIAGSLLLAPPITAQSITSAPGVSAYTASFGFPTSAFSKYYYLPDAAKPTQEPQPMLFDPVLNITFPYNLTNPDTIPDVDPDPVYFPVPAQNITSAQKDTLVDAVVANITTLLAANSTASNCTKCQAVLTLAKSAVLLAPERAPDVFVSLCQKYKFASNASCVENYAASNFGQIWTQILFFGNMSGLDGQYVCNSLSSTFCAAPATSPLNLTGLFKKPKPVYAVQKQPSGKRVKVLHMSDFHVDPRYKVGSEGNCTSGLCCRSNNANTSLPTGVVGFPAPLYGAYKCDTPYDLGLAALQAVGPLTGTNSTNPLAWTVYTGDLVAHDNQNQLSRAFTEYAELSIYTLFKQYLTGPVFAALGNHDSNPEAIDTPHSLPGRLGEQQSWNYDHVAGLWQNNGWITAAAADQARTHYGGYSIKHPLGLRIITFNTDFWYKSNFLNFINTTNPDNSGIFSWMIDELQSAEDAGERVWIVGHVLSGWDGSNPLPNPTDLFYQIVDRFSPHVIANIFFGHTHEDQFMIYYAQNGTTRSAAYAQTPGWIGPSVTPLTNLNSGFRLYEVDTGNFEIYNAWTFYADVNSFPDLSDNTKPGPTFRLEYSTRAEYGPAANWPADAPLNATFWHTVTEAMEKNVTLVSRQNTLQGKSSIRSPNCTSTFCQSAKICYMRSGSVALGRQCAQGFGSVQSAFTGKNS